jgi:glycosyl transferase family 25
MVFLILASLIFFGLFITFLTLYLTQTNQNRARTHATGRFRPKQNPNNTDQVDATQNATMSPNITTVIPYSAVQNPFEKFDRIYYINMDHRLDRKYQIESELLRMHIPTDKIQRIAGVKAQFGALGCSKAHLNALLDAQARNLNNCLILEDDFEFSFGRDYIFNQLHKFWYLNCQWDMLLFSSRPARYEPSCVDFLLRVTDTQTTAGYAVHKQFFPIFIQNVQDGIQKLETTEDRKYTIDEHWKSLQSNFKWYTFYPLLAHQRDSFSDIEQRDISYRDTIEVTPKPFEYLIAIQTTEQNLHTQYDLQLALKQLSSQYPIYYFFYYGDPTLPFLFSIDSETHIVTLCSPDDSLNKCHKFSTMLHFLQGFFSINSWCQNLKGVLFLEDNTKINSTPETFYNFLQTRSSQPYWGHITHQPEPLSTEIMDQLKRDPKLHDYCLNRYFDLFYTPIAVETIEYCSSIAFYMNKDSIAKVSNMNHLFAMFPTESNLQYHLDREKPYFKDLCVLYDLQVSKALAHYHIIPTAAPISEIITK